FRCLEPKSIKTRIIEKELPASAMPGSKPQAAPSHRPCRLRDPPTTSPDTASEISPCQRCSRYELLRGAERHNAKQPCVLPRPPPSRSIPGSRRCSRVRERDYRPHQPAALP